MELGTALILGFCILAISILLAVFKPAGRKLIKWGLVLPLLAILLLAAILAGWHYGNEYLENRPEVTDSLGDFTLGQSKADVLFFSGEPCVRDDPSEGAAYWFYDDSACPDSVFEINWTLIFKDGVLSRIIFNGPSWGRKLNGISTGDSYKKLIDHLGEPSSILESCDALVRRYTYESFQSAYSLSSGVVSSLMVTAEDYGGSFKTRTCEEGAYWRIVGDETQAAK
ncbi:MAG: hypothetical protein V2I38_04240 [Alcanivoracaceae bacterium]|jgi:hypothetical protein|nr:hypothetical protein [Alcanivoracaceae bacterium]